MLSDALENLDREYELNPGDGAFYGPKIDFHVTDTLGRSWQLGTCQLDFFMPERFDLSYIGADDERHRPLMIHRALLGSMERFAGILIEHWAGRFPAWLAPVQAVILPVADRHADYARSVADELRAAGSAHRSRRSLGERRAQDPRRRARAPPVHAGGRRPRAGGGHGLGSLPRRGRSGRDGAGRPRRRNSAPNESPAAPSCRLRVSILPPS